MSDEKRRTVNMDGLSENAIDAFQEAADALKGGKGMWLLDDESYDRRIRKAENVGSTIAFISTAITSAMLAIIVANEDSIKKRLSRIIRSFTKK